MSLSDEAVIAALLASNMDAAKAAQLLVKTQGPMASAKTADAVKDIIILLRTYVNRNNPNYSETDRIGDLYNAMLRLDDFNPMTVSVASKMQLMPILNRIANSNESLRPLASRLYTKFFVPPPATRLRTGRKDLRDPRSSTVTYSNQINPALEGYPWQEAARNVVIDTEVEMDPALEDVGKRLFTQDELFDPETRQALIAKLIAKGDIETLEDFFEASGDFETAVVIMPAARAIRDAKTFARDGDVEELQRIFSLDAIKGFMSGNEKKRLLEKAQRNAERRTRRARRLQQQQQQPATVLEPDEDDDVLEGVPSLEDFTYRKEELVFTGGEDEGEGEVFGFDETRAKLTKLLEELAVMDSADLENRTFQEQLLRDIDINIVSKFWPQELGWAAHDVEYPEQRPWLGDKQKFWEGLYQILKEESFLREDVVMYFFFGYFGETIGLEELLQLGRRLQKRRREHLQQFSGLLLAQVKRAWDQIMNLIPVIVRRLKNIPAVKKQTSALLSLYMEEWKLQNLAAIKLSNPIPETKYNDTKIVTIQDVLDSLPWVWKEAFPGQVEAARKTGGVPLFGADIQVYSRVKTDIDTGEDFIWDLEISRRKFRNALSLELLLALYWWQNLVFKQDLILKKIDIEDKVGAIVDRSKLSDDVSQKLIDDLDTLEELYYSESDVSRKITKTMTRSDVILTAVQILLGMRLGERNSAASRFIKRADFYTNLKDDDADPDQDSEQAQRKEIEEAVSDPAKRKEALGLLARIRSAKGEKVRFEKGRELMLAELFEDIASDSDDYDVISVGEGAADFQDYDDPALYETQDDQTKEDLEKWATSFVQRPERIDEIIKRNEGFEDRNPEAREFYLSMRRVREIARGNPPPRRSSDDPDGKMEDI